jgi:hypothetical protein
LVGALFVLTPTGLYAESRSHGCEHGDEQIDDLLDGISFHGQMGLKVEIEMN